MPMPTPTAMPTTLRTARLVLGGWSDRDTGWYADLVEERSAAAARRGEPPTPRTAGRPTPEAAATAIRTLEATIGTALPLHPVRSADTDEPLGYCGLVVGRSTPEEPELAYEFRTAAHGHGFATEAAAAVVEAARSAGYRRLWATIRAWNTPSFAVAGRVGFVRDAAATAAHPEDDGRGELVWTRLDL